MSEAISRHNATSEDADRKYGQPRLYGFRAVYVFDISQTEGKELATLTEVQGDVGGYRERLVKFVEAQSIELRYSDKIGPAKGLSHGGKITLLSGMQPAEEFSTLVHEIGHEMLHRGERRTLTTKTGPRDRSRSRGLRGVPGDRTRKRNRFRWTTSSSGMETPISCARVWKPFSAPLP